MTMDRFLEGVITGIVDGRRDIFNPALFYGDMSETKLVIARLIREYRAKHPVSKITQISGEIFIHKLILSIKDGHFQDFRRKFYKQNLLVFEGVEAIAGKNATMEEFYCIFDRVYESGGQIVVTSSMPPSQIPLLEERIRTQLEGGLILEI